MYYVYISSSITCCEPFPRVPEAVGGALAAETAAAAAAVAAAATVAAAVAVVVMVLVALSWPE